MGDAFEVLREACTACTRCGLCETRTKVVFGEGVQDAEVLVGEGPGQQEDELGLPFVGRSGKLLDVYLDTIQLSRQKNAFIANIVKCRPPGNRDPLPQEREACLPWLREQFRIIRPNIIVCVGRIAAQVLIKPDFAVMKEHGQWFEKNGVLFTATLHPAALLRNPNQKPLAFEDFVAIREKIKEVCTHTYP
ncbi:MAG: uracil-DNA glycosylase family protein [Oscillospiraceae bacterium]